MGFYERQFGEMEKEKKKKKNPLNLYQKIPVKQLTIILQNLFIQKNQIFLKVLINIFK